MDYYKAQSNAAKKIKANGLQVTLTSTTPGTYDPVTGSMGAPTIQTWNPYCIKGGFPGDKVDQEYAMRPGSLVQFGDILLLMEAGITQPLPGDQITMQGDIYTVIAVNGLDPGGVDILYKVWVRRG